MDNTIKIKIKKGSPVPTYATEGASGLDLVANLSEDICLTPGSIDMIPTGIRVSIPEGFEMQIRPRSGIAASHCITVLNTPGSIDGDYTGEIFVILINLGKRLFIIKNGMRIAQAIICPIYKAEFIEVEELDKTKRGEGGFGSTGLT